MTEQAVPQSTAYGRLNPEKVRAARRRWREANRERQAAMTAEWRRRNPERVRAYEANRPAREGRLGSHGRQTAREKWTSWEATRPGLRLLFKRVQSVVYRAIKSGRLVRPDRCEACGKVTKPHAAHHDYSRPLEVRWLCRACHLAWDHAEPKTRRSTATAA